MPNIGRPSRDCELCRSRRVKCDLGRPYCQRCVKYGVQCPGYRDLNELVFRNVEAQGSKKRRRSPKQQSECTISLLSSASSPGSSSAPNLSPAGDVVSEENLEHVDRGPYFNSLIPAGPPPSLAEHWTAHSVPIIMDLYSSIGFIRAVYYENDRDGPLIWAAHLFTRTYMINLQNPTATSSQALVETQQEIGVYLGKTLKAVGAALKTSEGPTRDDVLATVWILASYELLIGSLTGADVSSPWFLHTRGLCSLLKSRGIQQFSTPMGRMGFWPAFNMVQIHSLLTNEECPPETEEWLNEIERTIFDEEHLGLNVSRFAMRIARSQRVMSDLMTSEDHTAATEQFDEIIDEIAAAELELDALHPKAAEMGPLDHYMYLMRCSLVVKVHGMVQLFINFLTHDADGAISRDKLKTQWDSSLVLIRSSSQEILECVPLFTAMFATGNVMTALFEGLKTIWPLTCVQNVTGTLPEQKEAASILLSHVGRQSGIRQAFRSYDVRSALPPEAWKPLKSK